MAGEWLKPVRLVFYFNDYYMLIAYQPQEKRFPHTKYPLNDALRYLTLPYFTPPEVCMPRNSDDRYLGGSIVDED